jgi:hypothetical protein
MFHYYYTTIQGYFGFLVLGDTCISPPDHFDLSMRSSLNLLANRMGFEAIKVSGYSRIQFCNVIKGLE